MTILFILQVAKDITSRTGKVILSASLQNGTVVFTGVMALEYGQTIPIGSMHWIFYLHLVVFCSIMYQLIQSDLLIPQMEVT